MPTICELQIEAKKKGLRGYSKLKKADLEAFVKGGKTKPAKAPEKKTKPAKAPEKKTKPPTQERLKYNNVATSGVEYRELMIKRKKLVTRVKQLKAVIDDRGATASEKKNAKTLYDKLSVELEQVKHRIKVVKPQYDEELKFNKNNKKK